MSVAAFIVSQRAGVGVPHAVSCLALGVSESWLYKWRDRPPTPGQARRAELVEKIGKLFAESGNTYGSPASPRTCGIWGGGSRSTRSQDHG